jgi:hypothetical protein
MRLRLAIIAMLLWSSAAAAQFFFPWTTNNNAPGFLLDRGCGNLLDQSSGKLTAYRGNGPTGCTFVPSCTPSANFLTRANAVVTVTSNHLLAYDGLICGLATTNSTLDSNSLFSHLDAMWLLRGQDQNLIKLNIISSSYALTAHGGIASGTGFVADDGVTGDGTSGGGTSYYDTGFNPTSVIAGGGQFQPASQLVGSCIVTSAAGGAFSLAEWGATNAIANPATMMIFSTAYLAGYLTYTNNSSSDINSGPFSPGLFQVVRTALNNQNAYYNGALAGSDSTSTATTPMVNFPIYILARNNNGTADLYTASKLAAVMFGSQLSATDILNFRGLLQTYMTSVSLGAPAAC